MKYALLPYPRLLLAGAFLLTLSAAPAQAQWARSARRARPAGPATFAPAAAARAARREASPATARAARFERGPAAHLAASARRVNVNVIVPGREIGYSWNTTGGGWQYPQRRDYTYDAGARVTQEVRSDSASGALYDRYLTTYNAQGLETAFVSQNYNSGAWENSNRSTITYDSYGNETEYHYEQWQNNAWVTQDRTQTTYTYNAAGYITQATSRRYDPATGLFQFSDRRTFTFANGQWNELLFERWDGTAWVGEEKFVDIVWANWPAQEPASYRAQTWSGGTFVDDNRWTFTWGANGSVTEVREEPTGPGGDWQPANRYTSTNDTYGNEVSYRQEDWSAPNTWTILSEDRNLLTYGPGGELLREVGQELDVPTGQFVNNYRVNYSNFQTIVTGLRADAALAARLYPNPTAGRLTLDVPGLAAPAPGAVRDALGRVVATFTASPQPGGAATVVLDLGALPAGIYAVTLQTPAGAINRRVVRE